jgi:hypothetical protein
VLPEKKQGGIEGGLDKAKNFVLLPSPLSGEWVFERREACKCQKVRNFVALLREGRREGV